MWQGTVLPAKSDSDTMFCLQSYLGLIIDRLLVCLSYPQDRNNTQVIYRFALAQAFQVACTSFTERLVTKYYVTVTLGWYDSTFHVVEHMSQ